MQVDKSFLSPSKKMLAMTAALALIACTVTLWGLVSRGGKVTRQNAELALRMSEMAPEPVWTAELTRASLTASLRAARPELPADAQICFAAPHWAIVHTAADSTLLKWEKSGESFVWSVLDETAR